MKRTWSWVRVLFAIPVILVSGTLPLTGSHGPACITDRCGANYESKPQNTQYHSEPNSVGQVQDDPTPLPKECAYADLKKLGWPVMVDEDFTRLLFGFSVGAGHVTYGQEVPIYFWLVNRTDQPQSIMSCDINWFQRDGFDIFDVSGHRLLTREEQENPQYHKPDVAVPFSYGCDGNAILTIAPHTCTKPERPGNLAESYVLREGKYIISPRKTVNPNLQLNQNVTPRVHPGRLVISIEPREAR